MLVRVPGLQPLAIVGLVRACAATKLVLWLGSNESLVAFGAKASTPRVLEQIHGCGTTEIRIGHRCGQ